MLNHKLQEAGVAISRRIGFAVIGLLGTAALYAEGVLKDALLEIPLLIPILWVMVSPLFGNREKGMMIVLSMACLTLVACDLLARPFAAPYLHYNPANMFSRKLPNLSILGRWDADVFYQGPAYGDLAAMKGEEKWREIRNQVFQTDSAGFRNGSLHQPVDLILLGDSFTAGIGTSQDKLFSRLLGDHYGRSVYNMGYPGGPYDEYLNFAIESPKLDVSAHAEIVWVFYEGNDLDDPGGETWDLPALPWQSRIGAGLVRWRTFRNRSPINQIMESIRRRMQGDIGEVIVRALPDGRWFLFAGWQEVWGTRSQAEIEAHSNFQRLGRTMEAMQRLATERNVGVSVLIMPTKGQVYRWVLDQRQPVPEDLQPSGFARSVLELCDRLHFRCFDLKAYLATEAIRMYRSSGELLWWRDDTHLGEPGHEAMAAFISQHVLYSRSSSLSTTHAGDTHR